MQHAWKLVERPGGSHTALDGKKSPDSARKCKMRKMRKMLFEIFEIFSFSRADKAFEIFDVFEVFSLVCNLQDEPHLKFLRFSVSIALTTRLNFFCPTGTRSGHHSPESS